MAFVGVTGTGQVDHGRRVRTTARRAVRVRCSAGIPQSVDSFLSRIPPGDWASKLSRADQGWGRMKQLGKVETPVATVVSQNARKLGAEKDCDVLICGGTLGIFLAACLARKGYSVTVVERGQLAGRDQEWNISRRELQVLIDLGVLTDEEVEAAIVTEYNPARVSFKGMDDLYVKDILNCGVSPKLLLQYARERFENELGGVILEGHGFEGAVVHSDGVEAELRVFTGGSGSLGAGGSGSESTATSERKTVRTRLLVDAMGNFSPIVRQMRSGQTPDGVCIVVGSCARGPWPDNGSGDLLYSFTPIESNLQYFWEAFPSNMKGSPSDLRTTYMFSYLDTDDRRPSLAEYYESYLRWLPEYQGVSLDDLEPIRALFGAFPTYRESPLKADVDRVLFFGDSSGVQSPLSFGGLGAMLRHLTRIDNALDEALDCDALSRDALGLVVPYMPSLSVTWLFQRAMSVRAGAEVPDRELINSLLSCNFTAMSKMGDDVLRPFLQDVVQFPALARSMGSMMVADPVLVAKIMGHVGPEPVVDWMRHFAALGLYDAGHRLSKVLPQPEKTGKDRYFQNRFREMLTYGSGMDH